MPRRAAHRPRPFKRRPRKGRPALVGFLDRRLSDAGASFKDNLAAVAGVCDVVEIGVPFSDPMADGTTIQRASFAALADGVTLPWILEELKSMQPRHAAPILLMSYLNPLLAWVGAAAARCGGGRASPASSCPDLPFEESGDLKQALDARRPGAGANGDAGDAAGAPGDAVPGSQGICLRRDHDGHHRASPQTVSSPTCRTRCSSTWIGSGAARMCRCARASASAPREQVARFAPHVDGVVVGSALVEMLERGEDVGRFLESLR